MTVQQFKTCSFPQIRVGVREFNSVKELIESGKTKGFERQMLGDFIYWWKNLIVRFPDKEAGSASLVEVQDKQLTVGYPSFYYIYIFESFTQALKAAEHLNSVWLKSEADWQTFVASVGESQIKAEQADHQMWGEI